jgi:dolichol-phosphate mannosyltransferase
MPSLLAARTRGSHASAAGRGQKPPSNRGASGREVSVVIPTRNEAGSVRPLFDALCPALAGLSAEIISVDDSDDETPSVVAAVAAASSVPVRLRHRAGGERGDGLGGAVKLGFEAARGPYVAVMDCDLQHPPEVLSGMVAEAERQPADLVIATRFAGSGSAGKFGALRQAISRGLSMLARLCFPRRIWPVSDPMSGFFLVRRARLPTGELRPHGFKILQMGQFPRQPAEEEYARMRNAAREASAFQSWSRAADRFFALLGEAPIAVGAAP